MLCHQPPGARSALVPVLARCCALPVAAVRDGERLRAGRVVVIPPGRHLLVTVEGRVALLETGGPPPSRPSADLLFTSLALVAAERSVAVVLSGAGHDGATGASALHTFGGVVVAADPVGSPVPSMPAAAIARDAAVAYVTPVADIAALLVALVARVGAR